MGTTKVRLRMADVEIEMNGRVGRMQAVSMEATFDENTPHVLADLLALVSADRRELAQVRGQRDALQNRGTALVVENRQLRADRQELADGIPQIIDAAFAAGQEAERRSWGRRATRAGAEVLREMGKKPKRGARK